VVQGRGTGKTIGRGDAVTSVTILRNAYCPYCKRKIVSITGHDRNPEKGDAGLCYYCGEIMEFDLVDDELIPIEATVEFLTFVHTEYPDINNIRRRIINRE
jgi:5-methylcytosine-specific restriction endonuclease McrA